MDQGGPDPSANAVQPDTHHLKSTVYGAQNRPPKDLPRDFVSTQSQHFGMSQKHVKQTQETHSYRPISLFLGEIQFENFDLTQKWIAD